MQINKLDTKMVDLVTKTGATRNNTFRDKTELDSTDLSIKGGLSAVKQARWRRQFFHLINKAGSTLNIPPWGLATAAQLCHRYFETRSMKKNDRFVIATACLHLAAKIQEAPKAIRDVCLQCERIRHTKHLDLLEILRTSKEEEVKSARDKHIESFKEEVLMAERAVLFNLGFDLNIEQPHLQLLSLLGEFDMMATSIGASSDFKPLAQSSWNMLNDSFRTILCLQFPAEKLALAAIWVVNELNKGEGGKGVEELIRSKMSDPRADFFTYFTQIEPQEVQSISGQMLEMYADPKRQQVDAPRGAAPPSALADSGTPDHQYQLATPALGMDRASAAIPIPSGGPSTLNKRKYEEVEGLEEGTGGPKMPKIEAAYEEVIPYEEVIHYEEVGLKVEGR